MDGNFIDENDYTGFNRRDLPCFSAKSAITGLPTDKITHKAVFSLSYLCYQIVAWALFLLGFPFFLVYTLGGPSHELPQRLGFYPRAPRAPGKNRRVWLHAASVGEVQVAGVLARELSRSLPAVEVWVSTLTRSGHQLCREIMPPEITCLYAPLDLLGPAGQAMRRAEPDLYICLETELWPEIIRQAQRHGAGPLLLNARLSEGSLCRYRRWPAGSLIRATLARFKVIAAIGEEEARRYRALGAAPETVTVCGNAKYDISPEPTAASSSSTAPAGSHDPTNPPCSFDPVDLTGSANPPLSGSGSQATTEKAERVRTEEYLEWRSSLGLSPSQPILVAGSTHGGEEELLLSAWRKLKRQIPGLVLVLAPRHLRRIAEVEQLCLNHGVPFALLSRVARQEPPREPPRGSRPTVIVVDSLGKLASLYAASDYVFCGGSLVPRGGHNLMEAAARGKPVLFGPHMEDFHQEAQALIEAGGGFIVQNDEDISQKIMAFYTRPALYQRAADQAGRIAREQRGASGRQVAIIERHL